MPRDANHGESERQDWIDAHCHLADQRFVGLVDAVLARSRLVGVSRWIQGGVGPADWQRQRELRERHGNSIMLTFGLHPWWVAEHHDAEITSALEMLPTVLDEAIALGELGLDFHPKRASGESDKQRQIRTFRAQLEIAAKFQKPVVLHVVRAHDDAIAELKACGDGRGGLVHSFSGTPEQGKAYIERGFLLSLSASGLASDKRRRLYSSLPIERVVIETDAPDQLPRNWPGSLNEPTMLPAIASEWGQSFGCSGTELLNHGRDALETMFALSSASSA